VSDRRDPTRSAGLRRHGRALVSRRVFNAGQQLRQAIQEYDVAGLREPAASIPIGFINWEAAASFKLSRAEGSIAQIIEQTLMMPVEWPHNLITKAVEHGLSLVETELRTSLGHVDPAEVSRLHSGAASIEVRGIAGETERRLLRVLVRAIEIKVKPETVMREVRKVIEKITRLRLNLMVNTGVVRAVNAGKLLGYKSVGIEQVGIDPEWMSRRSIVQRDSVACGHHHSGLVAALADAKTRKATVRNRVKANKLRRSRRGRSAEEAILAAAFPPAGAVLIAIEAAEQAEPELVNVLTAGDDKVCQDCEDIAADGPYEIDEASDLIPAHPNCRCAFIPFGDKRFAPIVEQEEQEEEEWEE